MGGHSRPPHPRFLANIIVAYFEGVIAMDAVYYKEHLQECCSERFVRAGLDSPSQAHYGTCRVNDLAVGLSERRSQKV